MQYFVISWKYEVMLENLDLPSELLDGLAKEDSGLDMSRRQQIQQRRGFYDMALGKIYHAQDTERKKRDLMPSP